MCDSGPNGADRWFRGHPNTDSPGDLSENENPRRGRFVLVDRRFLGADPNPVVVRPIAGTFFDRFEVAPPDGVDRTGPGDRAVTNPGEWLETAREQRWGMLVDLAFAIA